VTAASLAAQASAAAGEGGAAGSPYLEHRAALEAELARSGADAVGLAKDTSNLFRDRALDRRPRFNLKHFDRVIDVDRAAGAVSVEGMTTYDRLVAGTLPHGVMPCVVPQLKSITIGGAVAGVGIEASSFRYGLVHETIREMDVLVGDGRIVTCSPSNEHRDLFFGLPNSYGTLGYALKLEAGAMAVGKYVAIEHIRHSRADVYFEDLRERCASDVDFVDGTVFGPGEMYVTLGRFTDEAPYASDYTYERIYYRSIRERKADFLTTADYIWRWDTDWFWCSKNLGMQNPLLRRLAGRERLNSVTYTRIMRWNSKWGLTHRLFRLTGRHPESVIQDVDIPIERAAEFLPWLIENIGILPVWICPIRGSRGVKRFPLYPLDGSALYVNFGFWDVVKAKAQRPAGYYNRLIEQKVRELGGIKSLYSESYYEPQEFWATYDRSAYDALKRKYDPQGRLGDLYQKCVLDKQKHAA